MSTWLASANAASYQIKAYFSNADTGATFQPVQVQLGNTLSGTVLDTITLTELGDGGFPTGSGAAGTRGTGLSVDFLTDDTITLTVAPRAGATRGSLAAIRIESIGLIPEPGTLGLLAAAMLTLTILRRRR